MLNVWSSFAKHSTHPPPACGGRAEKLQRATSRCLEGRRSLPSSTECIRKTAAPASTQRFIWDRVRREFKSSISGPAKAWFVTEPSIDTPASANSSLSNDASAFFRNRMVNPVANPIRRSAPRLLLCFVIWHVGANAAEPVQCPAQLQVRQQVAAPVTGWLAAADNLPNILAGITFFDGKPENNASLAPDKQTRLNGKDLAVWNFGEYRSRSVYISCRYAWTSVTLQREMPKEIRSCAVTFNPRQTVAGLPVIEKIDCK